MCIGGPLSLVLLQVYPELGMDAWTYYLAFNRLAESVIVFWGHPVSPAMPLDSVDYFLSSDLYEPDRGQASDPTTRTLHNA